MTDNAIFLLSEDGIAQFFTVESYLMKKHLCAYVTRKMTEGYKVDDSKLTIHTYKYSIDEFEDKEIIARYADKNNMSIEILRIKRVDYGIFSSDIRTESEVLNKYNVDKIEEFAVIKQSWTDTASGDVGDDSSTKISACDAQSTDENVNVNPARVAIAPSAHRAHGRAMDEMKKTLVKDGMLSVLRERRRLMTARHSTPENSDDESDSDSDSVSGSSSGSYDSFESDTVE